MNRSESFCAARQRADVPNGVHRSNTLWASLNEQRSRFSTHIRGGRS